MAMTIVEQSGGQYHVLVIIADGQVFYSESNRKCIVKFSPTKVLTTKWNTYDLFPPPDNLFAYLLELIFS
jgi:hypothetical protein